jgi:hypothetical protein
MTPPHKCFSGSEHDFPFFLSKTYGRPEQLKLKGKNVLIQANCNLTNPKPATDQSIVPTIPIWGDQSATFLQPPKRPLPRLRL